MTKYLHPLNQAYHDYLFPSTVPLWPTPWYLKLLGKPAWRRMMYFPNRVNNEDQSFEVILKWVYYTK